MSTKAQKLEEEKQDAIEWLRRNIPEESTVFGGIQHVFPSNMGRIISFRKLFADDYYNLDMWIADLLGYKYSDKHAGLIVPGTGMDMIGHVVTSMAEELYGRSYALKYRRLF